MREEGFYWIKLFGEWTIGYWYGNYWELLGQEDAVINVDEVDEKRIIKE